MNCALQPYCNVEKSGKHAKEQIPTGGNEQIPGHKIQNSGNTSGTPLEAAAQFYAPVHIPSALPFHDSSVQQQHRDGRTGDRVDVIELEYEVSTCPKDAWN